MTGKSAHDAQHFRILVSLFRYFPKKLQTKEHVDVESARNWQNPLSLSLTLYVVVTIEIE
jgi:hypothetical protein